MYKFSQQKFIFFLLLILRYPIDKDSQEFSKIVSYIENDSQICPKCFQNQSEFCRQLRLDYVFDESFTNNLNILFGVRHNRILRSVKNSSNRIFAKYLAHNFDFSSIKQNKNEIQILESLSERFFNESRLDGMQFCPKTQVKRFVDLFVKENSKLNIWIHMNVNMQPILLPHLYSLGFPVPKTFATCGFTIFQSYEGVPLASLYSIDLTTKFQIAKQLLEGALQFSEGFNGFRIYITDLILDNVVYDQTKDKISFVDLDTVLIVDSRANSDSINKHEYLDCYDCFAFSPKDICTSGRSDINVFAVCQLFREDLKKDRTKGFLYPLPARFSGLEDMLNVCVDCVGEVCKNRFQIALELVKFFDDVIKNSK